MSSQHTTAPSYQYHYDAYAAQASQAASQWMKVIPIEDDDLTFGGKPLSDWYEEDRRRYSSSSLESPDEAQQRGRTRQRAYHEPAPTSHGHSKHGHGHKHHKKSDKKK